MDILFPIFGFAGVGFLAYSFYLLSIKQLKSTDKKFYLLNLYGALCLGLYSIYYQIYVVFLLQLFWGWVCLRAIQKKHK
jgi:hypothetical protein